MLGNVAWQPSMGALHSSSNKSLIGRVDGLVESHVDIGANLPLCLHGDFGIHANLVAVIVGFEGNAIVVDFGVSKGKHLEAAGIGKSGAMPRSKFGKAAGALN